MAAHNDDDGGGDHHHSFHIPNAFSRSEYRQTAAYEPLAREDDDTGEDDSTRVNVANDGEADAAIHGVESLATWSRLSTLQQACLRLSFGVLGAAVLLPFNAIITPSEFYRTLLRDTPHETSFMSWIVVAYNVSCIAFGAHATASMHSKSISRRIVSSSLVILVVLALAVISSSAVARADVPPSAFAFPLILILAIVVAAATSYLQLAVVTLSNAYGPVYLGTMLAGQGLVGAVVSAVQLVAAYANAGATLSGADHASHGEARAAVWFFAANTLFMVLALAMFWRLKNTATYKELHEHMSRSKQLRTPSVEEVNRVARHGGGTGTVRGIRRYMSASVEALYDRITNVQRKSLLASASIAYVFVVTLAVFPALTSRIRPITSANGDKDAQERGTALIFVAWHFLAFNASDFLGRTLPALSPKVFVLRHMRLLALLCLARTALVPLLAACNVAKSSPTTNALAVDVASPFASWAFFAFVILLGLSNGSLATNIFIAGPRQPALETDAERDLAAGLLSWWLTLGLALGSFASFFIGNV